MSDPEPPLKAGGDEPRQIPGLPAVEAAASTNVGSLQNALAEERSLSRGASPEELEADARHQEHRRNQRFRHHFENIAIVALWFAGFAITIVGGIWLWHMAMPEKWRWLKGEDVSHLQSIMTAGLLVGVLGNHFKKRMS